MCGLFGWVLRPEIIRSKKQSVRTLAVALLLQNDDRGGDSWGFYSPHTDRRIVGLGDAVTMKKGSLRLLCESPTVIGHTRKATTGTVSYKNCHPFRVGSVVGAHNGMVFNHRQLNEQYSRQCDVDSQHLFHHIAEDRELWDINAYGAIAFHCRTEEYPIFIGSFNDGELAYCVTPAGVVWSSDWRHLEKAVQLAGWDTDRLWSTKDDLLYRVDTNGAEPVSALNVEPPVWKSATEQTAAFSATGSATADEEDVEADWLYMGLEEKDIF